MSLVVFAVLGFITVRYLIRNAAYYKAAHDQESLSGRSADSRQAAATTERDPGACTRPLSVPTGWTVSDWARDGMQQIHIALVQEARRRNNPTAD